MSWFRAIWVLVVFCALAEGSWASSCSYRCFSSHPKDFLSSNFWLRVQELIPRRWSLTPAGGQRRRMQSCVMLCLLFLTLEHPMTARAPLKLQMALWSFRPVCLQPGLSLWLKHLVPASSSPCAPTGLWVVAFLLPSTCLEINAEHGQGL